MAILSHEELINKIKERVGEGTTDEDIAFVQDLTETIGDLEAKASSTADYEQKLKDLDDSWRKRYRDTFFSGSPKGTDDDIPQPKDDPEPEDKPLTFESLFKKG